MVVNVQLSEKFTERLFASTADVELTAPEAVTLTASPAPRGKNKNISSPIPLSLNPNPVRFAPTGLQDRSSFGISGWSERSCAWRGGLSIPMVA
uniref:Uncharacterized protein n=2 Tax=Oryza TaxID=4527 RepID=A0A0D3G984_9ORYZ